MLILKMQLLLLVKYINKIRETRFKEQELRHKFFTTMRMKYK